MTDNICDNNANVHMVDGEDVNGEVDRSDGNDVSNENRNTRTDSHHSRVDMLISLASNAAATAGAPSMEDMEVDNTLAAKRKEIKEIMQNNTLTDLEKRLRIQHLMDGRASVGGISGMREGNVDDVPKSFFEEPVSCVHYERKCSIVAPCCGKVFGCRVCHDELSAPPGHGPMDRFAIKEVVCKECNTRQPKSNKCTKCHIQFAEYYCDICNLWMSLSKSPFHCSECGFCRVGGRSLFRHCAQCCMCISASVYDGHNCMKDKYKNNCPVCREDMFSSRQSPQDLPCGHAIHAHCFRKLASFDYRCPICKKTVVSQSSMSEAWSARARDIAMQPMPADLARTVSIMCNDCETKSQNLNWHFLGVQCPECSSFNTVVEQVMSTSVGTSEVQVPGGSSSS